jgi:Mn-dependent DtxR family transcriptional regulator
MTCEFADKSHPTDVIKRWILFAINEFCPGDDYFIYTRELAEIIGIEKGWVTVGLLELRNEDLVMLQRGLMNEDGFTAGSGYGLTEKGKIMVESMLGRQKKLETSHPIEFAGH